jgi:hypothetical protein
MILINERFDMINDILKELEEFLDFSNKHPVKMVNLELIAIAEAQRKLIELTAIDNNLTSENIEKEILSYFELMQNKDVIRTYTIKKKGISPMIQCNIEIVPNNFERYKNHMNKNDYTLIIPKIDEDEIC